jgi:hypothetical protein
MSYTRSFQLYKISLLSAYHRLRYDFARELVVAICAAVILATFGYIFNDFLNVKVKELSPPMRHAFANACAWFGLALATIVTIRLIRVARYSANSLGETALRMGEWPAAVMTFVWLRSVTILAVTYAVVWLLIWHYLVQWPFLKITIIQLVLLTLVAAAQLLPPPRTIQERTLIPLLPTSWQGSQLATLVKWRLVQIVKRNRLTQTCLAIGLVLVLFAAVVGISSAPVVAVIFVCMVGGIFGSMALAFQLQEDLNYAWSERCMGIDHRSFEHAYTVIGSLLGIALGSIPAVALMIGHPDLEGLSTALKALIITWIPFFAFPSLMFQIDGRRPALQAVQITIVALFLGTAVLASWFSVIILPIFRYYVSGVQQGRFYRA